MYAGDEVYDDDVTSGPIEVEDDYEEAEPLIVTPDDVWYPLLEEMED